MTLTDIQNLLHQNGDFLEDTFGIKQIGVFGSYARETAVSHVSDIDILVEFSRPIGWEIVDLHAYLENLLGQRVDLVTTNALKPELKSTILSEVVYV
jgi:predicted nucleotidyltransferase